MMWRRVFSRRQIAVGAALLALVGGSPALRAAEAIEQKDIDIAVVRDPQLGPAI